jgi:ferric-dicitrate binding protein FerR (iron transport regulator)
MERSDFLHLDGKLERILREQSEHGERLSRVEVITESTKAEVAAVRQAQDSCPGRIAEIRRQGRRAAWATAGKLLAWAIGIVTAGAGAWTALAAIFGGQ